MGIIISQSGSIQTFSQMKGITASVSTRGRYFSTLPICINAMISQDHKPNEIIIYDDNTERKDLRGEPVYQNLFSQMDQLGIAWKVEFGTGEGQVKNHQRALTEAKCDLIWRMDDDNIPEPNVLKELLSVMDGNIRCGAVGGLVLDPKSNLTFDPLSSNKIQDIFLGKNEQWHNHPDNGIKSVDHLYSSFLFRKEATEGYDMTLSRVGHREETIFTYEMKRKGWHLYIHPRAVTWHYQFPSGGIRDKTKIEMWDHDERHFKILLQKWGIDIRQPFIAVLDSGIGDHYAFKNVLPKIKKHYEKIAGNKFILACCYPEIFNEEKGLMIISIADAKRSFGNIDRWNIYKFMIDHQWKSSIGNAYEKMYLS